MANIRKLEKLKRFLLAEKGATYRQNYWIYGSGSAVVMEQKPLCGTAGCLAGNAVLMEGYVAPESNCLLLDWEFDSVMEPSNTMFIVEALAAKILGLNSKERWLFDSHCTDWPSEAKFAYRQAKTPLERAEAACLAIDALIADKRLSMQLRRLARAERGNRELRELQRLVPSDSPDLSEVDLDPVTVGQ